MFLCVEQLFCSCLCSSVLYFFYCMILTHLNRKQGQAELLLNLKHWLWKSFHLWILVIFKCTEEISSTALWRRTAGCSFKTVSLIENKYMWGLWLHCCGLTDSAHASPRTRLPQALKQEKNTNKLYIIL